MRAIIKLYGTSEGDNATAALPVEEHYRKLLKVHGGTYVRLGSLICSAGTSLLVILYLSDVSGSYKYYSLAILTLVGIVLLLTGLRQRGKFVKNITGSLPQKAL